MTQWSDPRKVNKRHQGLLGRIAMGHPGMILLLLAVNGLNAYTQSYTNIAAEQGINVLVEGDLFGSGVSFYDFDDDGWDDLTFCGRDDSLVFYRNEGGQFIQLPSFLFAAGETKHVLWVDHDNDGDLDLTVTTWMGTYRLYENDGNFSFTDISATAGLAQNIENTYGCSWGDYDRDGDLDLYVCIYEYEGDQTNFSRMNHLYRNNGNGTFTDVTLEAGVSDGIKLSFQSVWMDYDQDGWPDLYVINDRWFSNSLYRNNGNGTFTDVSQISGTAVPEQDPMTASVADFDNDGDLDIYMTNTGVFTQLEKRGMLLVNDGNGSFTEEAQAHGVDIWTWSWGATWVDVDNDTWQDLYVTTSLPNGQIEDNVLFRSLYGEVFGSDPGMFLGDHNARSFAVARGDLNNDGAYDLVVQNQTPYKPFLWLNSGGPNNYIKFTLRGTVSNRFAIGSWIRVYSGGNVYTQYTHCGENYTSQNSQHHIFGLGTNDMIDSVQVEYVLGHTDTYLDLSVNEHYVLTEGETYQVSIQAIGSLVICDGDSVILDAGEHFSYLWNNGSTERYLAVFSAGDHWVLVQNEFGVQAYSDTISITVTPSPLIGSTTQNPLCEGDLTGSIEIENYWAIPAQSITWTNGNEGALLAGIGAGSYEFLFVDQNGCTATGEIHLTEPPALFIQVSTTASGPENGGSIEVLIFGGVPPYSIVLNDEPVEWSNQDLAPGVYSLVITDDNGCTLSEEVIIESSNGIQGSVMDELSLYPNPIDRNSHLTISLPTGMNAYGVLAYDAIGTLVSQWVIERNSATSIQIPIADLSNGVYLFRILAPAGAADHIVVVQ